MIGLDTNVVVRWLTEDPSDIAQSTKATLILERANDILFIHDIVLAEVIWVLSLRFGIQRKPLAQRLRQLVLHPKVCVAQRDIVLASLNAYETGGAGLVDRMIGALNRAQGCSTTLTFDKAASKGPDFTEVA